MRIIISKLYRESKTRALCIENGMCTWQNKVWQRRFLLHQYSLGCVSIRDDVDGESLYDLLSAESSDNDKTHELPDEYIITVWLHEE